MDNPRISAQIEQLQNPVDKLWWFAQLERGIEISDTNREAKYGSKTVLMRLGKIYERSDPLEPRIRGRR